MVEFMKGISKETVKVDREFTHSQMEEITQVNTKQTLDMEKVF
jgi:hypothetical protein